MKRIFEYQIPPSQEGQTIGNYLKQAGYSRHIFTHLKATDRGILKNGVWAYSSERLKAGDLLSIRLIEADSPSQILPVKMELSIPYEDEDIIVLDKPADMPVHPSINNHTNTLANGLAYYFSQKGESFTYRCINRLDRDTTGLLIAAKHMLSAAILSQMMKERKIHREYLAIAYGEVPCEGTICAPIARKDTSVIERTVDFERGEPAVTHYKRLAFKNGYSLVSLTLETGRTHQIRVHMKFLGFPLLGDFLYYPDYSKIERQSLHSHRLLFQHPISGGRMSFTSPLPPDMQFEDWFSNAL